MTQTPSVGRIVHYRSYGTPGGEYLPTCRAAIIAEVIDRDGYADHNDEVVALAVLNPTGLFFNQCPHVEPDEQTTADERGVDLAGGTWHWPERTPVGELPTEYSTEGLNPPPDVISATGLGMIQRGDRTPGPDVP